MLALALGAFSSRALAQDPVGFWQMEDAQWNGTAGEVVDSSGNGNNGTARTAGNDGSLPGTVDAKVCKGGQFRGWGFNVPEENNAYYQARHYVEVPASEELSPLATTGEISISGWVRLDDRGNTQSLVHKGASDQEYNVSFDNGRPELSVWNVNGSPSTLSLNYRVSEDEWYFFHARARVEEEAGGFWWWRYWDYSVDLHLTLFDESGNVVASDSDSAEEQHNNSYTSKSFSAPLIFGGLRYGSVNPTAFLDGRLDEVYIHDTELTTNEARQLALNTRPCSGALTCEPETFNRANLGDDWVTDRSNGSFTPQIVNGRLRMTEAVGNQATAATYQRTFPGADNLIQVEFDYYAYDGSGADGLAVVFSDASVTPQAGGYGGSLGYAQEPDRTGGFAGGWLGIGLDEYGNFSNNNEGRNGGNNGRTLDSVAVRGAAATNYQYITDSGNLSPGIDSNNDNNPFRYRITIDSRGGKTPILTVERKRSGTGQSFSQLLNTTLSGQPPLPENLFLSLTGSTGGSTNIHELDNLQICADKIGEVQQLVDHFEIEHSGTGLTCSPSEITIRACDNADCSALFSESVEVSMSPSGWTGGDTFTFTGSVTTGLQVTEGGTVTLGVVSSDPGTKAFSDTLCDNGSGTLSENDCDMTFYDSGFDISIPDHVSDTPVQATIAAVSKDDETERCVPGFADETKDVALWFDYKNPDEGTQSVYRVVTNGDDDPLPEGGPGNTTSLYFDDNGEAALDIRYPDVGRVELNALHEGEGDQSGLVMRDLELLGTGIFVARPALFEVSVLDNPGALDLTADGRFRIAGEPFEVEVRSLNASGDLTPNFGKESPKEAVSVEEVEPASDPSAAVHIYPDLKEEEGPEGQKGLGDFGGSCEKPEGGKACGEFSWEEVGAFALRPVLLDDEENGYLGTGSGVEGTLLPYVGRFWPKYFDISIDDGVFSSRPLAPQTRTLCTADGDRNWVYTGEPFGWKSAAQIIIDPKNSGGVSVENYRGTEFELLEVDDVKSALGAFPVSEKVEEDADGNLLKLHATLKEVNSFEEGNDGALVYVFNAQDEFRYPKSLNARVDEYIPNPVFILQQFEDRDGVTAQNPSSFFDKTFEPAADDDFKIRYGRITLDNGYGPENVALPIPLTAEVYGQNGFELHQEETCWFYDLPEDVSLNFDDSDLNNTQTGVVPVSDSELILEDGAPKVSPADYRLRLSAPGASESPDQKGVYVELEVGNSWLRDFWDVDNPNTLVNPSAWATFGVYRGNDRIIYWQEVLN